MRRRELLAGATAAAALGIAGCSRAQPPQPAARPAMLVHRDPQCGCCLAWAEQAAAAGYAVTVADTPAIAEVKQRLGVPADLAACHTAQVEGLVIEGHVPFAEIARLRAARPTGVIGLAVPGMPRGSPGMEMPDGTQDPFTVHAFAADGRRAAFAQG
jgi:hypothetical protein